MEKYEPLINFRPKTAEENVLWLEFESKELKKEISCLNIEIGMLKSELDELKHLMKTEEKGALILKNKKLKDTLKEKEERIKRLKKENANYLRRIIQLQMK